jgi:hypothetical protein
MIMKSFIIALISVISAAAFSVAGTEQKPVLSSPLAVAPGAATGLPQYFPRVAWSAGAKIWLVVWEAGLATGDETARGGLAQDIYAARISADGKYLDPNGILVCKAKDFQGRPVVASDGKDFLVVWHDMRTGKDWDLYAARVSSDGKVQDSDGFLVSGGTHNQCLPDVVFGAGNYYAVWLDMRHFPEYRVFGSRISPDGKVLDAGGAELIRGIDDKILESWRKASFAPGKHGQGWHQFAAQPSAPFLATSGKAHVLGAFKAQFGTGMGNGDQNFLLRRVDAAGGKPLGGQDIFAIEKATEASKWVSSGLSSAGIDRPGLTSIGDKGFMAATFFAHHGFGSDGTGIRVAAFLDAEGKSAGVPKVQFVAAEDIQRGMGYRSNGVRSNTMALTWDGKRALHVVDRYIQSDPKGGDRVGDMDVLGIFLDADGRRISDLASGATVEPDKMKESKPRWTLAAPEKVSPFMLADGPALQCLPAAAAGNEGSFLVVWQDEPVGKDSCIMARTINVK